MNADWPLLAAALGGAALVGFLVGFLVGTAQLWWDRKVQRRRLDFRTWKEPQRKKED